MAHEPYIRIVPGGKSAALFIHGILGTPDQFKPFYEYLPKDCSIYNILLDGHGKSVWDFSHSSMKKWKHQVEHIIAYLNKEYESIIIIAHSMGTLFAIEEACKKNNKIKALFLIDTPFVPLARPSFLINAFRISQGSIPKDDLRGQLQKAAFSIKPDKRLWLYLGWIPRYLELFCEIGRVRRMTSYLSVPCRVYLSQKDELVSLRSYKYLKGNPMIHVSILKGATHFYFTNAHIQCMQNSLRKICHFL